MTWFSGGTLLTWVDFSVLGFLLLAMVSVGAFFSRQQTSTGEFFLGGRRVPWWAACLSFVATEVSAVTIISVPATTFMENWQYLQFFIGSAAARLIIAYLFIPAFYKFNCTTIYQFLGARFGALTQITASVFFFVTRLLGSGVRLMAACLAMSVLLGWDIVPAILLFTVVSVVYIWLGGIKAVVWTNVLQALVFLGGGLATVCFLLSKIDGGFPAVLQVAGSAGKLDVVDWGPSLAQADFWKRILSSPNIFWLAILNGLFGSMAAFGTDQDLMQRLLTVETRKKSQKTMALTIPLSLLVLSTYVCIGTGLYVFYAQNPGLALPDKLDKIFPHFIGHVMPPLLRGLLLSAIVLASIDSPLASLATSFVTDVLRPIRSLLGRRPEPDSDQKDLRISRWCVVGFGAILALLAFGFSFFEKILWLAFKIGGVTFGSLLGVFLLGLLTQRRSNRGNLLAMTLSAAGMLTLLLLSEFKIFLLGWSWLVIWGTILTFLIGWVSGPLLDPENTSAPDHPAGR
ncbi:MAG: sodium/solute symporter [Elusimicrobia bacterium]|nr:sodium/solute symporter [Elusimicrobiota bacterium]